MATTRSIRYIETTQVPNASTNYQTALPTPTITSTSTGSGDEPWVQGANIINGGQVVDVEYDSEVDGLGNISGGSNLQSNTNDRTYYPRTEKFKRQWTDPGANLLTAHSSGIPASQCWTRLNLSSRRYAVDAYDNDTSDGATPSNVSYSSTATFKFAYRTTAQTHRTLTSVNETRTGGQVVYPSVSGDLFKVGSDAHTAITGTTTNDFGLSADTDDFSGQEFSDEGQTTITYATQGGPFDIKLSVRNWNAGFTSTLVRHWEGRNYIFDSSDADHTIPTLQTVSTMSVSGGIVKQFEADLQTTCALDENSALRRFAGLLSLSTTTTVSCSGNIKSNSTTSLSVGTELIGSTFRLLFSGAQLQGSSTFATTTTFKPGPADTLTAQVSTSTSAGLIYDITGDYTWDSFNLNSYFEPGFSIDNFALDEGEYTWNFLADSDWDSWPVSTWLGNEQTWDNWPDDVWETPYIVGTAASVIISPTFKLGDVVSYTGTFTFDEDSAFEKASQADITAQFTTNFTASGVIDVEADLSGAFAPSLTANITYDIQEDEIIITGAFSPVLTANAITDTFADIDVAFTFAVEPTFKPAGFSTITTASTFEQLVPTFKPAGFSAMVASAGTLTVGRLFFSADPYNIAKITQEIRRIVLPEENRQTLVMAENRLNTITQETGDYLVPQETRSIKLRIPPFKNRFSTPRVRSSQ